MHVGCSSLTRDWTQASALGVLSLNYGTSGEVSALSSFSSWSWWHPQSTASQEQSHRVRVQYLLIQWMICELLEDTGLGLFYLCLPHSPSPTARLPSLCCCCGREDLIEGISSLALWQWMGAVALAEVATRKLRVRNTGQRLCGRNTVFGIFSPSQSYTPKTSFSYWI